MKRMTTLTRRLSKLSGLGLLGLLPLAPLGGQVREVSLEVGGSAVKPPSGVEGDAAQFRCADVGQWTVEMTDWRPYRTDYHCFTHNIISFCC